MVSKKHHGKRCQEECIDELNQLNIDSPLVPLVYLLRLVSKRYRVHTRTLRRWFNHYLVWGEYPYETRAKVLHYKRKSRCITATALIDDNVINALDSIVQENPEFYLDEIAEELVKRTGLYLPFTTIYMTLKEKLNYSLQVCYEAAKQRDEVERRRYKEALRLLVKDVEQVLVIDETHKDWCGITEMVQKRSEIHYDWRV